MRHTCSTFATPWRLARLFPGLKDKRLRIKNDAVHIKYYCLHHVLHLLLHVLHVAYYHHCDLECQCIVKRTDIKSRALLQLFKTVYECITVDIKLTRRLGYIQVVLKEIYWIVVSVSSSNASGIVSVKTSFINIWHSGIGS